MQMMAVVNRMKGQYDDAMLYIDKSLHINNGYFQATHLFVTKGNIFLDMQQYDSAAYYFSKDTRYEKDWEKRGHHLIWAKFYEKKVTMFASD